MVRQGMDGVIHRIVGLEALEIVETDVTPLLPGGIWYLGWMKQSQRIPVATIRKHYF